MKSILVVLLFTTSIFAHEDHDWRLDYEAYLNVSREVTPVFKRRSLQVPQIDMEFYKEKLKTFASIDRKLTADLDKTREFLTEEYKKIGFEVSLQPFGTGVNFIAEKKGTTDPDKVLILSSHIDSVGNKGANDDGTGTIGVLTIARELSQMSSGKTIRILGFDREEKGLVGSDAYVATITNEKNIIGNINFEMMGYHKKNDGGFHVIDCDKPFLFNVARPGSQFLSQEVKTSIASLGLDLHVVKTCTGRSDHASFWRANIPAIVISENFFGGDGDPCYHAKCDVVDERINYEYIEKILAASLETTKKLIEVR